MDKEIFISRQEPEYSNELLKELKIKYNITDEDWSKIIFNLEVSIVAESEIME